jgi:hypothetical protein
VDGARAKSGAAARIARSRLEYLLPIRFDDAELTGTPDTVAYLDASLGMPRVAELLIRKLAAALAVT